MKLTKFLIKTYKTSFTKVKIIDSNNWKLTVIFLTHAQNKFCLQKLQGGRELTLRQIGRRGRRDVRNVLPSTRRKVDS